MKIVFNVNSESKGESAITIVKVIMSAFFILIAVSFVHKIIIDCIAGRADIVTALISFFVIITVNTVLQVAVCRNKK